LQKEGGQRDSFCPIGQEAGPPPGEVFLPCGKLKKKWRRGPPGGSESTRRLGVQFTSRSSPWGKKKKKKGCDLGGGKEKRRKKKVIPRKDRWAEEGANPQKPFGKSPAPPSCAYFRGCFVLVVFLKDGYFTKGPVTKSLAPLKGGDRQPMGEGPENKRGGNPGGAAVQVSHGPC